MRPSRIGVFAEAFVDAAPVGIAADVDDRGAVDQALFVAGERWGRDASRCRWRGLRRRWRWPLRGRGRDPRWRPGRWRWGTSWSGGPRRRRGGIGSIGRRGWCSCVGAGADGGAFGGDVVEEVGFLFEGEAGDEVAGARSAGWEGSSQRGLSAAKAGRAREAAIAAARRKQAVLVMGSLRAEKSDGQRMLVPDGRGCRRKRPDEGVIASQSAPAPLEACVPAGRVAGCQAMPSMAAQ